MNGLVKSLLIVLGFGLLSYSLYFNAAMIQSPQSARENLLRNAARQGGDAVVEEFRHIMHSVGAGWNVVAVAGTAIVVAACFIKSRPGFGPKKD